MDEVMNEIFILSKILLLPFISSDKVLYYSSFFSTDTVTWLVVFLEDWKR